MGLDYQQDQETLISQVLGLLTVTGRLYLSKFELVANELRRKNSPKVSQVLSIFERDLSTIISNSVTAKLATALKSVTKRYICVALGLPVGSRGTKLSAEDTRSEQAREKLLSLIDALKSVGLAGEPLEITFAEIMNDSMTEYVYLGCKGIWTNSDPRNQTNSHYPPQRHATLLPRTAQHCAPSRCVINLCEWIGNRYARLIVQVLDRLQIRKVDNVQVPWTQVEKWKEMGLGHLASLRIDELFDIVGNWPHSKGALDDLRTAITTPQRRLHLTDVFAASLKKRLLHPGASTLQILQTYISMISSFHALDHSKVLLDRVAYPLQLYLCSREDTVRVIITGLLSETEDSEGNPVVPGGDKLSELALILNNGEDQLGSRTNDDELDWHDMDWMPDPVDAGPGYKRSKNADIIGTLIGVLGSQDVFIKEFQNIVGENLLKSEGIFEKEARLIRPYIILYANLY
jgi:anaphase-promoting complex subunit 2